MFKSIKYWTHLLRELLSLDKSSMKFKRYISKKELLNLNNSDSLILIEFEQSPENILALSFFLPAILDSMPSKLIAFQLGYFSKFQKCKKKLQFRLSTTYKMIGGNFILGDLNRFDMHNTCDDMWEKIQDPTDLEIFEFQGIRIGDLIYDEYLAKADMHTVDFSDPRLKEIFLAAVASLQWWIDYLNTKSVNSIIVSHDVYLYGIPARLGVDRAIPVFLVSTSEIIRLNKTYPRVGSDIPHYPKLFLEEDETKRSEGLIVAKQKIQDRIHGIGVSDLYYLPLIAFSEVLPDTKILKETGRKRILIAVHDFYDSPHGGQIHFYPDFFLWLSALANMSTTLDYDWYIKTHPYLRGRGREILTGFVSKYSNFELLPSEISHNQIVSEGIDLVLTVYGTIATEYPLFGIRVMNASAYNPHAAYDFSFTPKSREEYEFYIRNLDAIPFVRNQESIYEYYYMRHLLPIRNWLFSDDERYKKETGFGLNPMTRHIYDYFLSTNNRKSDTEIQIGIRNFLASDSYQLSQRHFETEYGSSIDNA